MEGEDEGGYQGGMAVPQVGSTALNDYRVGFIRIQLPILSCIVLLHFVSEGSNHVFHLLNVIHPGKPLKNGGWRLLFLHAGYADSGRVQ